MYKKTILTVVATLDKGGVERVATLFAREFAKLEFRSVVFLYNGNIISERNKESIKELEIITNITELIEILSSDIYFVYIHNNEVPSNILDYINNSGHMIVEQSVWSKIDTRFSPKYSFQLSSFALFKYISSVDHTTYNKTIPVLLPNCFELETNCSSNKVSTKDKVIYGRIGQNSMAKWSLKYLKIIESTLTSDKYCEWILVGCPHLIKAEIQKKLSVFLNRIKIYDEIQNDSELAKIYDEIDYFVLISDIGESFGLVLFEAISRGSFVLTVSTPWVDNSQTEYVFNSGSGIIFPNIKSLIRYCNKTRTKTKRDLSNQTLSFLRDFTPAHLTKKILELMRQEDLSFPQLETNEFIKEQKKMVYGTSIFLEIYWFLTMTLGYSKLINRIFRKIWLKFNT